MSPDDPRLAGAWRIGLDGEALRLPMSGVGRYVLAIARQLDQRLPQAHFFAYARGPEDGLAPLPSERWQWRLEPVPRWRRLPSVAWVKWRSPGLIQADALSAYWAGRTLMPRLPADVRAVCTVHDLNAWEVPQTMPFKHRWAHRFWFAGDVRRAHRVVANSQGTADRLARRLGLAVSGLARPGVDASFADPRWCAEPPDARPGELLKLGIHGPYLLAVATLEPRKNLGALLQAFLGLKRRGALPASQQLVLIGAPGWGPPALVQALDEARPQGVLRTGYVDEALLPLLYHHADALVFPSIYEGYGMPALEARCCGTRVVVSDVPELREAAGPLATRVVPTPEGIAAGIVQALGRPRQIGRAHV